MKKISELFPLLDTPKKIGIISHPMPDGDAFGSMLGLYHFLKTYGHDINMVSPTAWGNFLNWMPEVNKIKNYTANNAEALKSFEDRDIIFCLDFNSKDRIGVLNEPVFEKTKGIKVLIDHHLQPETNAFDYGISNSEKSSTSEMIFDFIMEYKGEDAFNIDCMECIYTGVLTDTGSFRFPATTESVHNLVALFKRKGLKHHIIHEKLFNINSIEKMRFMGYVMLNKMILIPEKNVAYIGISKQDMLKYNVNLFDLEGLVNIPLSIEGIKMSALFSERDKEIKISIRSEGDIDVSEICRKHFSGGGHKNASGGKSNLTLNDTIQKFIEIL